MSWGYFADLRCKLPAKAWTALKKKSPADFPLAADWSGFESEELRSAFVPPSATDSFAKVLSWGVFTEECLRVEKSRGDKVELRVALVLDKSQLDMAGYLGALLEGVRAAGGDGSLSLINDGSYVGEDGHTIVVKAGKRTRKAIKDYDTLREKLTLEICPESFEDDAAVPAQKTSPLSRFDHTLDASHALNEAFAHHRNGDNASARDRVTAYFEGGGAMNHDLFKYYAAFLRLAPPTGEALERALTRLLGSFTEHRSLIAIVPLLENVVAFLNEHGRAAESVDLVFDAIAHGTVWSTALAHNATRSAAVARDVSRTDRLIALLRESPNAEMWGNANFLQNLACLQVTRGDTDGAFRTLEQCLAIDPNHGADLASDHDLDGLHGDPRWAALIGR